MAENQLPFLEVLDLLSLSLMMKYRTKAPESNLILVNPGASIAFSPKANLHSTEFAAKAINANPVKINVLNV